MERVLITGAGGFIGSYLSGFFAAGGYEVGAGVRLGGSTWRLADAHCRIVEMDIGNSESVEAAFAAFRPDAVINCAAYGAYSTQQDPKLIHATNVDGLAALLAASETHEVEKFVQTGSSSEYGIKTAPMKETDATEPYSEYGRTKVKATAMALEAAEGGLACAVIRPFSAYGDWEDKNRLIPALILSALAKKPANLSSPLPVRDFIYIEDLARGYKAVLESGRMSGEIFNLGCGRQYSVGDAASLVGRLVPGAMPPAWNAVENKRMEPGFWMADISKAQRLLGWKPAFSFEAGLKKSIAWFRAHASQYESVEVAGERKS